MNKREHFIFTSESVGRGHPDKICDQISDAILDEALRQDPESRVACETYASTGMILVGGEITTDSYINTIQVARDVLLDIGYDNPEYGIDCHSCAVLSVIKPQSADISQGVTEGEGLHHEQGAGDQGIMFGYACRESDELMPAPITYAHKIMRQAEKARKEKSLDFLRPDGKCQVTVEYKSGKPYKILTVVLSHQHDEAPYDKIKEGLIEEVIKKALPERLLSSETCYHINPTGRFVIGGPHGDVGLTGRKIIVDTYGGAASHGGGAFSGKDPSKVDRSAAYMARYIAKNIVAANLAERCEVQLAYAIGVAQPLSIYVDTFGTGCCDELKLEKAIYEIFPLTPQRIITHFDLKRAIYLPTASYGHFGDNAFPWEKTDKIEELKNFIG